MNKNKINESAFIKSLAEVDTYTLDSILKYRTVQDILNDLNNPDKMQYYVFMQELLMNICIRQQAYDKKHKGNPDYEAWKKDPNNPIWKTMD